MNSIPVSTTLCSQRAFLARPAGRTTGPHILTGRCRVITRAESDDKNDVNAQWADFVKNAKKGIPEVPPPPPGVSQRIPFRQLNCFVSNYMWYE